MILTSAFTGEVWADARDLEEMMPVWGSSGSCPGEKAGGHSTHKIIVSGGHRGMERVDREL